MKNKFTVGLALIGILTLAGLVMSLISSSDILKKYLREKELRKAYAEESASVPELRDPDFEAYGFDLLVKVKVGEKGTVTFWYDPVFIPKFVAVNNTAVEHICEFPDGNSSFVVSLLAQKDTLFDHSFDFEIKTLADIVTHFDALAAYAENYRKTHIGMEPVFMRLPEANSVVACKLVGT